MAFELVMGSDNVETVHHIKLLRHTQLRFFFVFNMHLFSSSPKEALQKN